MPYVLCQSTLTQTVWIREQRYSKEKNMQITLFKRQTEGHTYGGSGRKMFNRVRNIAGGAGGTDLYGARAERG
jgi:hypothetical protein